MLSTLITLGGMAIFVAALVMTLRANPRVRMPFWRKPLVIPRRSIPLRAVGAGLFVFGALMLSTSGGWWWAALVASAGLGTVTILMAIHNARVRRNTSTA